MKALVAFVLLAACSPVFEMPAPVAYTSSCSAGDINCERRLDAQALYYIGEPDAAQFLMCQERSVAEAIGDGCSVIY